MVIKLVKGIFRCSLMVAIAMQVACGSSSEEKEILTFMSSAGFGVENLEASVTFFEDGLNMTEVERLERDNRTEVVMASQDGKGAEIVLMSFTDGVERDVTQNPGKIVFYTSDASQFAETFEAAGGEIVEEPVPQASVGGIVVGFGRDINNNIIEIVEEETDSSYVGAIGVGVSDLDSAYEFYVNELGFNEYYYIPIPGKYYEYILTSDVENTPALVIMNWVDGEQHNYTDNPVKIVLETNNPKAVANIISASGNTVTLEPRVSEETDLNGATVGYAKDEDGTLIEIRDSSE